MNAIDTVNAIYSVDYETRDQRLSGKQGKVARTIDSLDIAWDYTIFITSELKIVGLSPQRSNILHVSAFNNDTTDQELLELIAFFQYVIDVNYSFFFCDVINGFSLA